MILLSYGDGPSSRYPVITPNRPGPWDYQPKSTRTRPSPRPAAPGRREPLGHEFRQRVGCPAALYLRFTHPELPSAPVALGVRSSDEGRNRRFVASRILPTRGRRGVTVFDDMPSYSDDLRTERGRGKAKRGPPHVAVSPRSYEFV
jgi:hypothetical protein